jgi:hypothetical protein
MRYAHSLAVIVAVTILGACGSKTAQRSHGPLAAGNAIVAVHVACLDADGDNLLTANDAAQSGQQPLAGGAPPSAAVALDFDADGEMTEQDAVFLQGIDIPVDPGRDKSVCENDPPLEFIVGSGAVPAIDCTDERPAVLLVGVAGGVANLREPDDGAGVRYMINGLRDALSDTGMQSLAVVTGPAAPSVGTQLNDGMEQWLTHAVAAYLERFPCARAVFLGHSHGAVTTDVVSSRLEEQYGDRIALVVRLDRIDDLYFGDKASMPAIVPVFNTFETNDETVHGQAYDAPNVENWDAGGETGPEDGEDGGAEKPVLHSTIDNSDSVRQRIIEEVLRRLS